MIEDALMIAVIGVLALTMIMGVMTLYLPSIDVLFGSKDLGHVVRLSIWAVLFAAIMPGTIFIAHTVWYANAKRRVRRGGKVLPDTPNGRQAKVSRRKRV